MRDLVGGVGDSGRRIFSPRFEDSPESNRRDDWMSCGREIDDRAGVGPGWSHPHLPRQRVSNCPGE